MRHVNLTPAAFGEVDEVGLPRQLIVSLVWDFFDERSGPFHTHIIDAVDLGAKLSRELQAAGYRVQRLVN